MANTSTYTTAFNGFDNKVIEEVVKSSLGKLDANRFLTVDYELTENPGMIKSIHRYTIDPESDVESLGRGEGNTKTIEAQLDIFDYEVKRTQGKVVYFDDDYYRDATIVDSKLRYLTEKMIQNYKDRAMQAMLESENICEVSSGLSFDDFCNALSKYTAVHESTDGLFWLGNIKLDAKIRKTLNTNLIYNESYIKEGAIGTILSIPCFLFRDVPEGYIFLGTKDAVKCFLKKGIEVEQQRLPDFKENDIYCSTYDVVALVDETKMVVCAEAQTAGFTLTTPAAEDVTIAGAGVDGAIITASVNGKVVGTATVASSAYSIGYAAGLVSGDVVKVRSHIDGKADKILTATVA